MYFLLAASAAMLAAGAYALGLRRSTAILRRHDHEFAALERSSRMIEEERRVLDLVAKDTPLQEVLDALTRGIERLTPNCLCSILLMDEEKRRLLRGSSGSLPEEYMQLVHGIPIGPNMGSCGTAAFTNLPVIAEDIETDERWAVAKQHPLRFGLRACWSVPIRDSRGVLGTFAMYHRSPMRPSQPELRLVEASAQLAGNVIQRMRAEQRLRDNAERLGLAEQAAAFGIWEMDAEAQILKCSTGFLTLLGLSRESHDLPLNEFRSMVHPEDRKSSQAIMQEAVAYGDRFDLEFRVVRPDGVTRWLHGQGRVERTEGRAPRVIGATIDVTNKKEMTQKLETALEASQAAARAKSEFLANMSHEIRTPMNGILGMTAILADTGLNPDQSECVETIQQCGESLLHLVNSILDLAKIEAVRLDLERVRFDPAAVIAEAVRIVSAQAREKGLEARTSLEAGVPGAVIGDPLRLRQILLNLLANAVKFTPRGSVIAGLAVARKQSSAVELCFSVCDTGIGISDDVRQKIFEPFSQADTSITRRYGGTGLGLTICQRLVALMGGRIELESEAGRGSTFRLFITLPLAEREQPRRENLQALADLVERPG